MDNNNDKPVYILQRESIDANQGAEFTQELNNRNLYEYEGKDGVMYKMNKALVLDNPYWFKLKKKVVEQPIKVISIIHSEVEGIYQLQLSKNIPSGMGINLCNAIESVLNPTPPYNSNGIVSIQIDTNNTFESNLEILKYVLRSYNVLPKDFQPIETDSENKKQENGCDYEILEIICYGNELRMLSDGLYRLFPDGVGFDLEYLMKKDDSKIKSVLRKKDSTVFSIGDEVSWSTFKQEHLISEFKIDNEDGMRVLGIIPRPFNFPFSAITKTEPLDTKPLFTTEDGKSVYEGDYFYFVESMSLGKDKARK